MQETKEMQVRSLGWEDPLEEGMATHCSVLAWRISGTEEPGGLHSPWGRRESDTTEHSTAHRRNRREKHAGNTTWEMLLVRHDVLHFFICFL